MAPTTKTIWTWRQLINESDLASTTKLVLHVISCYMNEMGGGCYPTVATIARNASLTERAVCTHIDIAEKAGFLKSQRHGLGGQKWARHEYEACWPEGTERHSVPSTKALNLVQEGTERDDKKALNDVQCISPVKLPENNTPQAPQGDVGDFSLAFKNWWPTFPHRGDLAMGQMDAHAAWLKIGFDTNPELLADLLEATAIYAKITNGYVTTPAKFLKKRLWVDICAAEKAKKQEQAEEQDRVQLQIAQAQAAAAASQNELETHRREYLAFSNWWDALLPETQAAVDSALIDGNPDIKNSAVRMPKLRCARLNYWKTNINKEKSHDVQ